MRALYINLDRSDDRRKWMENQAERLGICVERFPAVDGSMLDNVPRQAVSVGAFACFLSHRATWSDIAAKDDEHTLILEDDVHLSPDLPKFLADTSWLPPQADIVHLERAQKYCRATGRSRPALDRSLWRVPGENTGAAGYIISRGCARLLSRDFTAIDREFDQILFNGGRPDLIIYKILPSLCMQDKSFAAPQFGLLIDRPSAKMQMTGFQKLRRELRRIGRQTADVLHLSGTRRLRVGFS